MTGQSAFDVIVYHNPRCGTSRTVLELARNAGVEPHVIEYLKTPPTRAMLAQLARRAGSARALLRGKEPLCASLGLLDPACDDGAVLDAIAAHPELLNRPVVVSPLGVKACRPASLVLSLLPPQQGEFIAEDGERLVDEAGRPVRSA
ncbi:arsenate reductase (glutaredoxin) [Camelimonas abortus]|uniref:Arsenate reductase n=1 Tax=Camelimonas abortus TaxID=1017184 RepID=A0ABV7LBH3_9HYPH